ncbi:beta-ketoacyl synthase [Flavobacterium alkalisoli]|uniref:Beta-ketoacyl synthase n=1 Tax=Flavobacterium alkalisoli TaxID=2602769 RepID=A0A5B9FUX0_9FLAO|nr:beta-ketoacyl synthase N-terminal-like domain-containing protein [Flavobacterium alkalisoli]QEE48542.1 beta-ketoacyl synthase [Flavobacterium alkalisoli]
MAIPVSITSIASFSPLGNTPQEVWTSYLKPETKISFKYLGNKNVPVAALNNQLEKLVGELADSDAKYRYLDKSVLYAILASRNAAKAAGWKEGDVFGINIGSSRGATELFENHYSEFINTGKTSVQASPSTTLGNISSWIAHDLKSTGPEISHSITCSTALHALLNGIAWLRGGMSDKFMVGGSEAPLTPFTIAQMQAMKIYSSQKVQYPCRSLDMDKGVNTMVLGEGAAIACLEPGRKPDALAYIEGIGYSTEVLKHSVSISTDADCLQKSMLMALEGIDVSEIDAVVMHAPGTIKGDLSEYNAIKKVFGNHSLLLTSNKWKIGHTFGASGLLSLEMAIMMLNHEKFIGVPFVDKENFIQDKKLSKILVNAVGFGGNAVSILITR